MSDLHVVAVLKAKPGSEEAMAAALGSLVKPTLAEEGCLAYELFESAAEAGTFVTVERWRSQDDLDAHMKTQHIAAAMAAGADLFAAAPAIHPLKPVVA
jgi:quinol monooxygenase YgiN